jgi:hypothetical protein
MKRSTMRRHTAVLLASILTLAGFAAGPGVAGGVFDNFSFTMVQTNPTFTPKAAGNVTISPTFGLVENMQVAVSGLPANTDFDLFVIQVPTPTFGLAWYMGDLLTDSKGTAVQSFVGRFSIGTFIVAPGVDPAPVVLKKPPFPDASKNPATAPVQLYHLGLWFDSQVDARKAGCGTTVTPFNSTHHAGVQVLNTSNFPLKAGPLFHVVDR